MSKREESSCTMGGNHRRSLVFGASNCPPDSLIPAMPGRASLPGPVARQHLFACARVRPDWVLRPAVRASDRQDGGAADDVPRPRPGRPVSDTSCGSSKDGRLHRAVSRRLRSGSDRQNAGCADGQEPDHAGFPARRALKEGATLPRVAGLSAPRGAEERIPATPPERVATNWNCVFICRGERVLHGKRCLTPAEEFDRKQQTLERHRRPWRGHGLRVKQPPQPS